MTFFYKQLHFLLQPGLAYGRMSFQTESYLEIAYSIHFQPKCIHQLRELLASYSCLSVRTI